MSIICSVASNLLYYLPQTLPHTSICKISFSGANKPYNFTNKRSDSTILKVITTESYSVSSVDEGQDP